ncbi:MAG: DUF1080 domain-containing protein [Flavobacteriaceae bacterium]|nr:DUF1080 domain-containing protein [Flavobacteriaceae bacterium]
MLVVTIVMVIKLRYVIFLAGIILFTLSCREDKGKDATEKWIDLFNGKDLNGWHPKVKGYPLDENPMNTFKVKNGALVVSYDEYASFDNRFGHIFYKTPYSNYRLRLEYRFVGEQAAGGELWALKNSGIMIHCQSPESMTVEQSFPVSLEVQLLGGYEAGVERPTANLCTPGTHVVINGEQITEHCINSTSETFYDEEWIAAEVLVLNDSLIRHYINGKEVISYSNPIIGGEYNTLEDRAGEALTSGYISLQSESHPIEFRNIRLMEIKE